MPTHSAFKPGRKGLRKVFEEEITETDYEDQETVERQYDESKEASETIQAAVATVPSPPRAICLSNTAILFLEITQAVIEHSEEATSEQLVKLFDAEHLLKIRPWESLFQELLGEYLKLSGSKLIYLLDTVKYFLKECEFAFENAHD